MRTISEPTRRKAQASDDTRRPVWLEATESIYKKLNRIAKQCEVSRYDALIKASMPCCGKHKYGSSPLNRNVKSPAQSEVFRRTMGQVSRNYWATVPRESPKSGQR